MTQEGFKRKLTAILSADVEGYSRLMDDDEEATIRTLTDYRNAIGNLIQHHQGRIVDTPGDNILSEFASAVDAVKCAMEIQRELAERNAELTNERVMEFRIGVNVGDVVEEEGRIYGDGVNIAARMENLAEAGGILISGRVYDQVENKLDLGYEYLGEKKVKNITRPVRVYRVLSYTDAAADKVIKAKRALEKRWGKAAFITATVLIIGVVAVAIWQFYLRPSAPPVEAVSHEATVPEVPTKPSIAVLPFENLSEDPAQEYFSRGITEEIITGLSKIKRLYVIASHSTLKYKGKPVDVRKVGQDLGVTYVLEGNVRKDGERVRITAQLVNANTGHHVWVENYDRNFKDIFALQDDVTIKIMKAMRVELTQGEQAQLWGRYDTEHPEVYERHLKAHYHLLLGTKEDNTIARQLWEEAIALDPNFAVGYMKLGWTYFFDARYGWSESRTKSFERAFELAQKTLAMDETIELTHCLLANLHLLKGQYQQAITEAERGVELNPNGSDALMVLGFVYLYSGMAEETIPLFLKAIRLNPVPSAFLFYGLGHAHLLTGRYGEAIAAYKKSLQINSRFFPATVALAAAYSYSGRKEDARTVVTEILRNYPKFSVDSFANRLKFKNQADKDRFNNGLRKAGLK